MLHMFCSISGTCKPKHENSIEPECVCPTYYSGKLCEIASPCAGYCNNSDICKIGVFQNF